MAVMMGGGGGIPGPKPPPEDPILALMQQYGLDVGSTGPAIDYQQQMQEAYAPQFSYLDNLGKQSVNRANESGDKLQQLYSALQGQIGGQEKGIRTTYDQSLKDVSGAYGQALGTVKNSFDSSRNGMADTLARLGIEEAAPSAVGKQSAMQALMQSVLGANNQAAGNTLRSGKQSAITFNTQQKNAAGLAGVEAQSGLRGKLQDFLSQLDLKRADLSTQVNTGALNMKSQADQDAYARMKDERDFNYRMGKDKADYDLALQKLTGSSQASPKLDPLGQVNQLALQLYGNSQGAGNAVKAVTDALAEMGSNGEDVSYASLMATLNRRLQHLRNGQGPGDQGNLRQLAALLYDQMYG